MRTTFSASVAVSTLKTANGSVLSENRHRVNGLVQNLAAEKLYVKKGPDCSASDFTALLSPGSAEDDGYGGSYPLGAYTGVVSVFAISESPRCMVSEDIA